MLPLSTPYRVTSIPKGVLGIDSTLSVMRELVRKSAPHPTVRGQAIRLTVDSGPYQGRERARKILDFVRDHLRFVPDPVGVEAITVPDVHLDAIRIHGQSAGDCDDGAVLIGALCRAVGLQTRFVAASFLPTGRLHHVWTEAYDGRWLTLDPFRSETFGKTETARKLVRI